MDLRSRIASVGASLRGAAALDDDPALSVFVAVIGVWFLATALIWNHTTAGRLNAVAVALACFAIALVARTHPVARWLHVPLALWLFASPWTIAYDRPYAVWNNIGIGVGLLLIPLASAALRRRRPAQRRAEGAP